MLKTLREDGFDVTLYERRSQVGGIWAYTNDTSMTTVLPSECIRRSGCPKGTRLIWHV
jgi:cation diffusion facilitator CzcD-associated flavoprotein CzcO